MGSIACNGWRFWSLESDVPGPVMESAKTSRGKKVDRESTEREGCPGGSGAMVLHGLQEGFLDRGGHDSRGLPREAPGLEPTHEGRE